MRDIRLKNQIIVSASNGTASSGRLRILFLAPFAPSLQASHGGGRVIAQLITHLSQRWAVGLCYLRTEKEPAVDHSLQKRCERIEEVVIPEYSSSGIARWPHRLQVWKKLLSGKPLWAIDRFSTTYEERLKGLLATWHPDIVQVEFHIMGQYLPALEDYPAPRLLIQHEPGAEAARESLRSPFAKGRITPLLDLLAWKRFERRIVQQVQTVVVFTERDRRTVRQYVQQTPMVQIPLGTEIPEDIPNTTGHESLSLLFVGNFKHLPNLDAAHRLVNKIFPRVLSQLPETRLFIVGDRLPDSVAKTAHRNVVVTGHVPDVMPYLRQASLVVVPLRLGGGMRVKVLEALAAGKAVVASPRAVEGLDLVNGDHVILAETDEDFARAIISLLRDSEKRLSIATQAHAWVATHFNWGRVAEEYEKLYRCLLRC